jgi:hypothetical protein
VALPALSVAASGLIECDAEAQHLSVFVRDWQQIARHWRAPTSPNVAFNRQTNVYHQVNGMTASLAIAEVRKWRTP